jgi:hypothetical protein
MKADYGLACTQFSACRDEITESKGLNSAIYKTCSGLLRIPSVMSIF